MKTPTGVSVRILPRRLTLRARLTVIYGGLFFAAGVVLLAATYILFLEQLEPSGDRVLFEGRIQEPTETAADPRDLDSIEIQTPEGDVLKGPDARKWLVDQEDSVRHAAGESLLVQGGIALLVVGGLATGLGWLAAGRVLSPLHRVTATAHRISAAPAADMGLHERIGLAGPDDEVRELAVAFDSMVERLDRSFAGQRRFVANASHELRTPLTVSRAMVELAMHRPEASADLRTLGADLLALNERHERLISGLLDLAGAENEPLDRQPVDLADIVEHVVELTADEAEEAGVEVTEEVVGATTQGDALLLERLVANLVENGIRHNERGGWVRVVSGPGADGGVRVEVSNTGPVVSSYDVAGLFQPFRRQAGDRLVVDRGVGLGLSIVEAIVRAHDGSVDARPRDGGGLVVTVRLRGDDAAPAGS
ncbi:sensor histidine kinase [Nocardioides bizhenqiangii]|uniref:histidine kinase n=1 Tax=Nocardioides bizhenqiangii TaxID=3095076 RepID=A0ABZ0ZN71_9ACTN|nr:HAMP domain-containing sensor histidine kinase [Nocardioides sp. HM61]WQQ25730.1 HAMP domain-containing sensor histidine kinase [Nocardioides sp. HM61]